jgi:hypothetical protein
MEQLFSSLTQIRKLLVIQQSSINELITAVDDLIGNQMNYPKLVTVVPNTVGNSLGPRRFPNNVVTKRDKLKFILSERSATDSTNAMSSKEIKNQLTEYGSDLPNVDQSLVNLERDGLIFSNRKNGRKMYYMKK